MSGSVTPPPSQSAAHRGIICAALADGCSHIAPYADSKDMQATTNVMRALGTFIRQEGKSLIIDGSRTFSKTTGTLDCLESGSTLRFIIPISSLHGGTWTFIGRGRLAERPLDPYLHCLPQAGVTCETPPAGGLPLTIHGALQAGDFSLPGNVSSQFVTGLLLALPLLQENSHITLTSPLESVGYVNLTLDAMHTFGVTVKSDASGYFIPGGQHYQTRDFTVEADWSQAAFWLVAGALSGPISVCGLNTHSKQGDANILKILEQFGAKITQQGHTVTVESAPLHGIEIDGAQIPDLIPVLATAACFASGTTVIRNAGRLRLKESDRLHMIAKGLNSLGAQVTEQPDGLTILGPLQGNPDSMPTLDGANDHRIVMALSIAAAHAGGAEITDAESIQKSYPTFFTHLHALGGISDVVHMG
ncbi:MAG TPA: 3-phosphoshikimate 1-carboxyvinyltransferase [Ruminococcaceae bacterium]|nr:3-phosphoshikimate 1-carboxyvinyltransferase [Oscillospiraceae bacterium]